MKTFIILLMSFSYITSLSAQSLSKTEAKYNYLIYLPKDHLEKKYPVIIYLHGSSHRGNDLNKLKQYGLPHEIDKGQEFDFIIISPQCPDGKLWSTENWFGPLYAELISKYQIDTNRIYLTGVSMGGGGVFDVAKDYPDKFAALVPLCAWASGIERLCSISHIPIWTFHGTEDNVVPISQTVSKVEALKSCNGNIQFTSLENQGHRIQWLYGNQESYDIYEWMLKHKK